MPRAGTPRAVSSPASRSTSSRSASGTRSVGAGPEQPDLRRAREGSARTPPGAGCAGWCSSGARRATSSRAPGKEPWMASSVRAIAVGWWAKSSITVTPPATPRTSWRRFTPRKASRPAAISARREAEPGRGGGHAQRVLHVVRARPPGGAPAPRSRPPPHQVEARAVRAQRELARLPVGRARPPRRSPPGSGRAARCAARSASGRRRPGSRPPAAGRRSARRRSRSGPRRGRCRRGRAHSR